MGFFAAAAMSFLRHSLALLATAATAATTACAQPPAPPDPLRAATGSAKVTTRSGMVFEALRTGSGAAPGPADRVRVHYRGTFPDGREFDSSHRRGQPAEFALDRVIPCWTEALQLMRPGGKARIVCPPALAYGARGAGGVIPPNATLNFEIELVSVVR